MLFKTPVFMFIHGDIDRSIVLIDADTNQRAISICNIVYKYDYGALIRNGKVLKFYGYDC